MSICSSRTIALSASGSSGSSRGTSGGPCITGAGLRPAPFFLPAIPASLLIVGPGSSAAVPPSANLETSALTWDCDSPASRAARTVETPSATRLIASSFVRTGFDLYVALSGSCLGSAFIHADIVVAQG